MEVPIDYWGNLAIHYLKPVIQEMQTKHCNVFHSDDQEIIAHTPHFAPSWESIHAGTGLCRAYSQTSTDQYSGTDFS